MENKPEGGASNARNNFSPASISPASQLSILPKRKRKHCPDNNNHQTYDEFLGALEVWQIRSVYETQHAEQNSKLAAPLSASVPIVRRHEPNHYACTAARTQGDCHGLLPRGGAGHFNRGSKDDMPLDSLYRLYQFITIDDTIELRNEIDYFFNIED